MATVGATSQSAGIVNMATGSFTGDGTVTEVVCGFKPRVVKVFNATDAIVWEKFEGMGATISLKTVTAGTTTADATTAITLDEQGFTLTAALAASAKAISWVAMD